MSADSAAKWILETERPNLIGNWFKNRASDARQLRETAKATVRSGLDENKQKPSEVLEAISEARRGVAYLASLVAHVAEEGHQEWSSDPGRYRFASIAAGEAASSMSSDLNDIARLEELVRRLIECADRLIASPT